jgi:hypothetical protein
VKKKKERKKKKRGKEKGKIGKSLGRMRTKRRKGFGGLFRVWSARGADATLSESRIGRDC